MSEYKIGKAGETYYVLMILKLLFDEGLDVLVRLLVGRRLPHLLKNRLQSQYYCEFGLSNVLGLLLRIVIRVHFLGVQRAESSHDGRIEQFTFSYIVPPMIYLLSKLAFENTLGGSFLLEQ